MYFVPHFGHVKVYETSIWTPCFQILAKTLVRVHEKLQPKPAASLVWEYKKALHLSIAEHPGVRVHETLQPKPAAEPGNKKATYTSV